ncbi:XrtA/PEP-CTERM system amidotransferase [Aestuariibacter salexigens]|uniref:XrtA/PEP-CTERM system amidotransferase n=1 Tax=Aestuariibacter salexigens TaxID=226010 RepID=UPI00041F935F|nr:XrtA/PEP-CTERM system amidotransferase [Aestuariibacter salexigens]
MCGISGIYCSDAKRNIDEALLKEMNRVQSHRGPDEEGYYFGDGIGLGHRRLSIIDLSSGQQPLFNEDNSVVIVFNGEIYNHKAVKQTLVEKGHLFKTHSDTETIVHAWEEWREKCVDYLNGMFAFAIWDTNTQELFIARDRFGEKPLYYCEVESGCWVFGSELKVLTRHPKFIKQIEPAAIEDYLTFGYVPEPKSIYKNVHKLSAGHYLYFNRAHSNQPSIRQYWDLPLEASSIASDVPELLAEKLKQVVGDRLESEVPLGAFLSGGVDSSSVVAMMSQLRSTPVKTCAIGFDVPEFNESDFAKKVADHCATEHHLEVVSGEHFELLDRLPHIYDEPFADNSAIPTYLVCEMARKHVTVALSGDAGDELFAGYRRYRFQQAEANARTKLPNWVRQLIIKPLSKLYPKLDWAPRFLRAKTTLQSLAMSASDGYLNSVSILRTDDRFGLYADGFKDQLNGYTSKRVYDEALRDKQITCPVKLAQYLDFKTWLPGDILVKVDRASMANSLEVRVPMLDHEFVEWAFSIPTSENITRREGKVGFKKAMEPHLPQDILYRDKMGFSVPVSEWLKGPLKSKLNDSIEILAKHTELFSPAALTKLVNDHMSGRRDNGMPLWALLNLGLFFKANEL